MPTVIKAAIHLLLHANATQPLFLIRDLKPHHPLPMPLPFLEAPRVNIAGLGVDHFALAVRLVFRPAAGVRVAVCERHVSLSGFGARDEGAGVSVAEGGD